MQESILNTIISNKANIDIPVLTEDNLKLFFRIKYDDNRINHIMGVIKLASIIEKYKSMEGRLITSALYHDIGFSRVFTKTGIFTIDSAIKAFEDNLDMDIIYAILTHSAGQTLFDLEKRNNNLNHVDFNILVEDNLLEQLLTFCDLHISDKGQLVNVETRISELELLYKDSESKTVLTMIEQHKDEFIQNEKDVLKLLDMSIEDLQNIFDK